jgi:hypothetical protein
MLTQEQKQWILDDTIQFYNLYNRGIAGDGTCAVDAGCEYKNRKGNKCAIGRLFTPDSLEHAVGHKGYINDVISSYAAPLTIVVNGDTVEMCIADSEFYAELQRLHDYGHNWYDKGLSEIGAHNVRIFASTYGLLFRNKAEIDALRGE